MNSTYINITALFLLALSATLQAAHLPFPKTEAEWAKALTPNSHMRGIALTRPGQAKNADSDIDHPRAGAMVQFDFNSASVRSDANAVLDALGRSLGGPLIDATLIVEGHTDAKGSADYNMRLSKLRAEAVRNYLISQHGIAPERLQTAAYGEKRPIADNNKESGRALNRRVEFMRVH